MNHKLKSTLFVAACAALAACSEKNSDRQAEFTVQLNKVSALVSLSEEFIEPFALATSLKYKLGGVDLVASCAGDNPPGTCLDQGLSPDPDIWVNEGCNNDIAQCTNSNTQHFELIDPTAANAALASQGRSIDVGTFTKVRVYLLNNDDGNALLCNNATVGTAKPATPKVITLAEPVTVEAGESVTVTLNYITSSADCSNDSSLTQVFSNMTATVTKQ